MEAEGASLITDNVGIDMIRNRRCENNDFTADGRRGKYGERASHGFRRMRRLAVSLTAMIMMFVSCADAGSGGAAVTDAATEETSASEIAAETAGTAEQAAETGTGPAREETHAADTAAVPDGVRKDIFGVWMWPDSVSEKGADEVFDECAAMGVTDVYFLTKGLRGTVAFLTPLATAMERGRDLLLEAVEAAHARGIRLHAWLTSASDESYKSAHPESGVYHYKRKRDSDVISMTDGGYIEYMKAVISDLAGRYDIDGIHLDYIRYSHVTYGWSEEDYRDLAGRGADTEHLKSLIDKTYYGQSPDGDAVFRAYRSGDKDALILAQKRRGDVSGFASALAEAARAERPEIELSAALMPEGGGSDISYPDLHYGQNYADLSAIFDVLMPMAYSRDYGADEKWVGGITEGAVRCGKAVVTGVQAYEGGTVDSVKRDTKAALDAGADGVCLFRYGTDLWKKLLRVRLSEMKEENHG